MTTNPHAQTIQHSKISITRREANSSRIIIVRLYSYSAHYLGRIIFLPQQQKHTVFIIPALLSSSSFYPFCPASFLFLENNYSSFYFCFFSLSRGQGSVYDLEIWASFFMVYGSWIRFNLRSSFSAFWYSY